jgi:ATP-dependent Clp protease ATP-binding subunit ClpB
LGSDILASLSEGEPSSVAEAEVMAAVRGHYAPEFLNRVDEIVLFNRLQRDNIRSIVDLQIRQVEDLLEEKEMKLHVNDDAREWLSQEGYSPFYGARPLKRLIQHELLNPMAIKLLDGSLREGDEVYVKKNPTYNHELLTDFRHARPLLVE